MSSTPIHVSPKTVDTSVGGAKNQAAVTEFWSDVARKAWEDDAFYKELQKNPTAALKAEAQANYDGNAAINDSIDQETRGVWTMDRLPAPPNRDHPGLSAVSVEDGEGYKVSHTHLYPPTCC